MSNDLNLCVIAHIKTLFPTKFGVPRQSGLVKDLPAKIVMEPKFRTKEAFRGLEGYSHIWLIWEFSEAKRENWSATVRPPRLGGNTKMGVFATRSPFRPNPIGLSSVKLDSIQLDSPEGPLLHISGADLAALLGEIGGLFEAAYPDPVSGQERSMQCYCSERIAGILRMAQGVPVWTDVKMSWTER